MPSPRISATTGAEAAVRVGDDRRVDLLHQLEVELLQLEGTR